MSAGPESGRDQAAGLLSADGGWGGASVESIQAFWWSGGDGQVSGFRKTTARGRAGACGALTTGPGAEGPLPVHSPLRADGAQTEEPRGLANLPPDMEPRGTELGQSGKNKVSAWALQDAWVTEEGWPVSLCDLETQVITHQDPTFQDFFFSQAMHAAYGILVPRPGLEPTPLS